MANPPPDCWSNLAVVITSAFARMYRAKGKEAFVNRMAKYGISADKLASAPESLDWRKAGRLTIPGRAMERHHALRVHACGKIPKNQRRRMTACVYVRWMCMTGIKPFLNLFTIVVAEVAHPH